MNALLQLRQWVNTHEPKLVATWLGSQIFSFLAAVEEPVRLLSTLFGFIVILLTLMVKLWDVYDRIKRRRAAE